MKDFLFAVAGFSVVVALIVYLEYRSRPREDRRTSALRAANRDPGKGARR